MAREKTATVVDPSQLGSTFSIAVASTTPGCAHCGGLMVLAVSCDAGVIGTLRSDYPWHLEVTSDPATHPPAPHFDVEWAAYDIEGNLLSVSAPTVYFAAEAMMRLARAGEIAVRPVAKSSRKKG